MPAAPTLATLMLDGREPFQYPPSLQSCVRKVLSGEYGYPFLPDHPRIRRVLDVGANVGAAAVSLYKFFRVTYGWDVFIDCYEPLPAAADLCEANKPPGAKVHRVAVTTKPGPVKLHVGSDWGFSSLDGKINPRSGEVVEVPTLHPAELPEADMLKMDIEGGADDEGEHGGEIELLRQYFKKYPGRLGVVAYEWHRENVHIMEQLCRDDGLRLFKSAHDCVSLGLQVWVRSKAINGDNRYVLPLPG